MLRDDRSAEIHDCLVGIEDHGRDILETNI